MKCDARASTLLPETVPVCIRTLASSKGTTPWLRRAATARPMIPGCTGVAWVVSSHYHPPRQKCECYWRCFFIMSPHTVWLYLCEYITHLYTLFMILLCVCAYTHAHDDGLPLMLSRPPVAFVFCLLLSLAVARCCSRAHTHFLTLTHRLFPSSLAASIPPDRQGFTFNIAWKDRVFGSLSSFEFGPVPQIARFRRLRALWTDWKTVFIRHNWT